MPNGRLTLSELEATLSEGAFSELLAAGFEGKAEANLHASLGIEGVEGLPQMDTDFYLLQQFGLGAGAPADPQTGQTSFGSSPVLEFRNTALNLSHFVSSLIGPALSEIQKVTKPVQPLVDILTTPVPVLSDLEGETVTFLDLAALLGGGDARPYIQAVETVVSAIDLIDSLETSGDVVIQIGTYKVGGDEHDMRDESNKLSDAKPSGDATEFDESRLNEGIDADKQSGSGIKGLLAKLKNSGIKLPFVTSPSSIFGLISGDVEGVNFFEWAMPRLDLGFEMQEFFPVFPGLQAFFGGGIDVFVALDFGYDGKGIAEFMTDPVFDNADKLFNGFYVRDYTDPEADGNPPEVEFVLTVDAGAAIGISGLVEAGVEGGLQGIVNLDLNSEGIPDGLMRAADFAHVLESRPQCLFDVSGELDVFLDAFLWVGLDLGISRLTLFEKSIEFIRETLVDFNFHCQPEPPPTLATLDGDVLYLNMGPRAGDRGSFTNVTKESFSVSQLTTDDGATALRVTGLGFTQDYLVDVNTTVYADGGSDRDAITIDQTVTFPVFLRGGDDKDRITVNAAIDAVVLGDAGDDILLTAGGNDLILGGTGNDTINSLGGNDVVFGDDISIIPLDTNQDGQLSVGELTISALKFNVDATQSSSDILMALQQSNIRLLAGADNGSDNINAGEGSNIVFGGDETIIAGDEGDRISAGLEGDILFGGAGNDVLSGAPVDATIGASDVLFGGDNDDRMTGGPGDDELHGDAGNDILDGQAGWDALYGGDGDDVLKWSRIVDTTDSDLLHGDAGNDSLQVIGGSDADDIQIEAPTLPDTSVHIGWLNLNLSIDPVSIENLSLDLGLGADDVQVADMSNAEVHSIQVDLGNQDTGGQTTVNQYKTTYEVGSIVGAFGSFAGLTQSDGSHGQVFIETTQAADASQPEIREIYHNGTAGSFALTLDGRDEHQSVYLTEQVSNSFTLRFRDVDTAAISANASASDLQAVLEAHPAIGPGNVFVIGSGTAADPWDIRFAGPTGGSHPVGKFNLDPMTTLSSGVVIDTVVSGSSHPVTTTPIAFDATAADVQQALSSLTGNRYQVTGSGTAIDPWQVTFLDVDTQDASRTFWVTPPAMNYTVAGMVDLDLYAGLETVDGSEATVTIETVQVSGSNPTQNEIRSMWHDGVRGSFSLQLGSNVSSGLIEHDASPQRVASVLGAALSASFQVSGRGTENDPWVIEYLRSDGLTVPAWSAVTENMSGFGSYALRDDTDNLATITVVNTEPPTATQDAQFEISHDGASGGFTLSYGSESTRILNHDISATDLAMALSGLTPAGVTVLATGSGTSTDPWALTLQGSAGKSLKELTASSSGLDLPDGSPAAFVVETLTSGDDGALNEVQVVSYIGSGEDFSLTWLGQATPSLSPDISAANLQSALEALNSIGSGNVSVTQAGNRMWRVEFVNVLAGQDVGEINAGLTPTSVSVLTTTQGTDGNELQQVWHNASGGTFQLSFAGATTDALPFDATFAEVQSALQQLASVGTNSATGQANVAVSGAGTVASPWTIRFVEKLRGQNVDPIELLTDELVFDDTTPVASTTTIADGRGRGEVQQVFHTADTGSFQLTFQGLNTVSLNHNADAADVQAALENLILENQEDFQPIQPGDITVTGSGTLADPWKISFLKPVTRVVGTRQVSVPPGDGDLAQDQVTLNGSSANDLYTVVADSGVVNIDAPGVQIQILNAFRATDNDKLVINSLGGNDTINAGGSSRSVDPIAMEFHAGDGNDRVIGSHFDDILDSGLGDDKVSGNAGMDVFLDAGGNDTLIETQDADMSLFANRFFAGKIVENLNGDRLTKGNAAEDARKRPTDPDFPAPVITTLDEGVRGDIYAAAYVDYVSGLTRQLQSELLYDLNDASQTPLFESAQISGGEGNNTLVVNDDDNQVWIVGQAESLAVTDWRGPVTLDNKGSSLNTDPDVGFNEYYILHMNGTREITYSIADTGSSGFDEVYLFGIDGSTESASDQFYLIASGSVDNGTRAGHVYAGQPSDPETPTTAPESVVFTGVDRLQLHTLGGNDSVLSDDTAVQTLIDLGQGDDEITIGTVPLIPDPSNPTLEFPEGIPVADTDNMTNGVSNQTIVYGQAGDDVFEVDHNVAELFLHGGADDDRFVVNTFLKVTDESGNVTNTATLFGGDGDNHYEHVVDAPITINGGSGIDTTVVVGTPIGETFVVTEHFIAGDGGITYYNNVEILELDAAGGDDQIYVLGAREDIETIIRGGSGDDDIHIGGNHQTLIIDPPPFTYQPPPFSVQLPPSVTFTAEDYTTNTATNVTFTTPNDDLKRLYGIDLDKNEVPDEDIRFNEISRYLSDKWDSWLSHAGHQILSGEPQPVGNPENDDSRAQLGLRDLQIRSVESYEAQPSYKIIGNTGSKSLQITYPQPAFQTRVGTVQYNTSTTVPPAFTFTPPPIALHVSPVYDVSSILGRVTIDGEETFEIDGDELIVHDQQSSGKTVALTSRINAGASASSPDLLSPNPTNSSASFEAWFKPSDLEGKEILFETGGTAVGSSLVLDGTDLRFSTLQNGTSLQLNYALSDADDFIHAVIALDFETNTMSMYVDGVLVARRTDLTTSDWSGNNGLGISAANSDLGGNYNGNLNGFGPFDGHVANVRIHSQALADDDVQALFASARVARTLLNFDARAGEEQFDLSGSLTWETLTGVSGFNWQLSPDVRLDTGLTTSTHFQQAYEFGGRAPGTATSLFYSSGNPVEQSAAFEIWFQPDRLDGKQVLWETGGASSGTSLTLDDSTLQLTITNGSESTTKSLSHALSSTSDLTQALGVVDLDAPQPALSLFVDGELIGSVEIPSLTSWSGNNDMGLGGEAGGVIGGNHAGILDDFGNYSGHIAALRIYSAKLSEEDVRNLYHSAVLNLLVDYDAALDTDADLVWENLTRVADMDLDVAAGANRESVVSDLYPQIIAARRFGDRTFVGLSGLTGIGLGVDTTQVLGLEFENLEQIELRLGDGVDDVTIAVAPEGLGVTLVLGGGDDKVQVNAVDTDRANTTFGVKADTYVRDNSEATPHGFDADILVTDTGPNNTNHRIGIIEFDYQLPNAAVVDATISFEVSVFTDGDQDNFNFYVWGVRDGWSREDFEESSALWGGFNPPLDDLRFQNIIAPNDALFDAIPGGVVDPIGTFQISRSDLNQRVSFSDPKLVDFLKTDSNNRVTLFITRAENHDIVTGFASKESGNSPSLSVNTGMQIFGGAGNDIVTLGSSSFQDSVYFDGAAHKLEQLEILSESEVENSAVITNSPPVFINSNTHGASVIKRGDHQQGTLQSLPFILGDNAIITLDAAGAGGSIDLVDVATGNVLESVIPNLQSVTMASFLMDASSHSGKQVVLRIIDNQSGSWGIISIDNIHYTADNGELLWNFEQGSLADTTGVNSFQATFGLASSGQPIPYAPSPDNVDSVNPNGGNFHVRSDYYNGPLTWPDDLYNITGDDLPKQNEVQELFHDAASGLFTLTLNDETSAPLSYSADAAKIQSELQKLSTIGTGNVQVSGNGVQESPWVIEFIGDLAGTNVSQLTGNFANLKNTKGDSASVTLVTTSDPLETFPFSPEQQSPMVFVVGPTDTRNTSGNNEVWANTVVLDPVTGRVVQDTIQKRGVQQTDALGTPIYVRDFEGGVLTTTESAVTFDSHQDIGSPGKAGSFEFDEVAGTYQVTGGGTDIWGTSDQFHYAYSEVSGNVELIARVDSITSGGTPSSWAKSGIMFRESTAANSRFVNLVQRPDNQVAFQWRDSTGGGATFSGKLYGGTGSTKWLKLVRIDDTFLASYSTDGVEWNEIGSHTIDLPVRSLAGLAVTAHDNTSTITTTFDHVQIRQNRGVPHLALMQAGEIAQYLVSDISDLTSEEDFQPLYLDGNDRWEPRRDPSDTSVINLHALGQGFFAIEYGGRYLSYDPTAAYGSVTSASSIGPNEKHEILSLDNTPGYVIRHGDLTLASFASDEPVVFRPASERGYSVFSVESVESAIHVPNDDTYVRDNGETTDHGSEGLILVKDTGPNETVQRVGVIEFPLPQAPESLQHASIGLQLGYYNSTENVEFTFYVWGIRDGWSGENFDENGVTWSHFNPPLDQLRLNSVSSSNSALYDPIPGGSVDPLGSITVLGSQLNEEFVIGGQQVLDFLKTDTNGRVSVFVTRAENSGIITGFYSKDSTNSKSLGGPKLFVAATVHDDTPLPVFVDSPDAVNQPGDLLWLRSDGLTVNYQRDVVYNLFGPEVDVFYAPVPLTETVNRTESTPIQRTVITTQQFAGNDTLQIASSGTVSNSDVYGANVWFDADTDGVQDVAESSALTDIEGRYELIIPDASEIGTGVVRSSGGIDVGIGLEPIGVLASDPAHHTFTTPLTTLALSLRDVGFSNQQIQDAYRNIFGIDDSIDVGNFDHFEEAHAENPLAKNVLIAITAIQNLSANTMELLSGMIPLPLTDVRARGALSESVYRAMADRFEDGLTSLTEQNEIVALLRSVVDWAEQIDERHGLQLQFDRERLNALIDGVAMIIVADLTRLVQLANEATTGLELVTRVNQAKKYTRVEIGPVLNNLGLDDVSIQEAIARFAGTNEAQLQQVRDVLLPPHMSYMQDLVLLEDEAIAVGLRVFDFETPFAQVEVLAQSNNDNLLLGSLSVLPGDTEFERRLLITPAADQSGSAAMTVTVQDEHGFSLSQDVKVTVVDVNDPPTFSLSSMHLVWPYNQPASISLAKDISPGTERETLLGQTLQFQVDVAEGDRHLFAESPAIDPDTGLLTFTPVTGLTGIAKLTTRLVDDGGTEYGGRDSSDPRTFYISLVAPDTEIQAMIIDVLPDPRSVPVDATVIVFSQPVTGFDRGDLVLRRDGSDDLLDGSNVELLTSDSVIWQLTGLRDLTREPGRYTLSLNAQGSEIRSPSGSMLLRDALETWVMEASPFSPMDVNHDGAVTSLDVLIVINYLNLGLGQDDPQYHMDVSQDGFVTPLDVLLIVNYLNQDFFAAGEGEHEFVQSLSDANGADNDPHGRSGPQAALGYQESPRNSTAEIQSKLLARLDAFRQSHVAQRKLDKDGFEWQTSSKGSLDQPVLDRARLVDSIMAEAIAELESWRDPTEDLLNHVSSVYEKLTR
ncbi:MAG: dockerin type I domain-containing protein [bacterium]|nr:dockerin type I domain-containing protein [bacterium]